MSASQLSPYLGVCIDIADTCLDHIVARTEHDKTKLQTDYFA